MSNLTCGLCTYFTTDKGCLFHIGKTQESKICKDFYVYDIFPNELDTLINSALTEGIIFRCKEFKEWLQVEVEGTQVEKWCQDNDVTLKFYLESDGGKNGFFRKSLKMPPNEEYLFAQFHGKENFKLVFSRLMNHKTKFKW